MALLFGIGAGYGWFGESRDWLNYRNVWDQLPSRFDVSVSRFERGYVWTSWFAKYELQADFNLYYAVLATSSLAIKFRLLWKYAEAPVIAAIVYLMLLYPLHEYTQIRAAIGFAFAYLGLDACLEGKLGSGVLLFALGALFHTTVVAVALSLLVVFALRNRPPAVAGGVLSLLAGVSGIAIPYLVDTLEEANPLARSYIETASVNGAPNIFSGETILLFSVIVSSMVLLRPWRRSPDSSTFLLGAWSLIWLVAMARVPTFAFRLEEAFIFPLLLFTFRFDETLRSRVPALLMIATGVWMFYESLSLGVIGT